MKTHKLSWGFFFILAAVLIIVNQLDLFTYRISFWTLFFTVFLVPSAIVGLMRWNFFQFFLSLGILLVVYSDFLGFDRLTPWSILVSSIFLGIGFSTIFKPRRFPKSCNSYTTPPNYDSSSNADSDPNHYRESAEHINANEINCRVSLSGSSKYVHANSLQRGVLECNLGALKVFFDHATLHPDGAHLNIDCSLGSIELLIPHTWHVLINVDASLGSVEERVRPLHAQGPTLTLSGSVSLGSLLIRYV